MAVFHPRARLGAYVEGALTPVSRARVSAHLAQCGECRHEAAQRERILQVASSVQHAHPSGGGRPGTVTPPPAGLSVLESREGVPGWKVVAGMGVVGLAGIAVLSAAWIAGDPAALAGSASGDPLWPPITTESAAPSAESPRTDSDAREAPAASETGGADPGSVQDAPGPSGVAPLLPDGSADGGGQDDADTDGDPAVALAPAGVDRVPASRSAEADEAEEAEGPDAGGGPTAGTTDTSGVALAGAVALTPEMISDLRHHGWNVPSLNGFGLLNDSTGWALLGDSAEVVMSLRGDDSSLVLHECRSLAEDAPIPTCPLDISLAVTGSAEGVPGATAREAGRGKGVGAPAAEVRELPVGVEMSLVDHGDGTWTATARTAQAAYSVESDLPVERADRVMTLVVVSERSWVTSGTVPERPADRLARGFERLLPWMSEPGSERR